ncbi:MAG: hypothetical protein QF578_19745 [Alphaproteobacteria bacterium]|jgi:hypothetical protein|nr:hypothetical protein [Alphaproteobacteria bacterium]MDP6811582.1 hypothetical protein [Alphaproteobacteria bacterium]
MSDPRSTHNILNNQLLTRIAYQVAKDSGGVTLKALLEETFKDDPAEVTNFAKTNIEANFQLVGQGNKGGLGLVAVYNPGTNRYTIAADGTDFGGQPGEVVADAVNNTAARNSSKWAAPASPEAGPKGFRPRNMVRDGRWAPFSP